MTRTEWLDARRQGIGASDAAAICGVSPWATPLHVYLDKVGAIPHSAEPTGGPPYWGLRLENVIASEYEKRTSYTAVKPDDLIYASPERRWQRATPDRFVLEDDRLLQLKTSLHGKGFGEEGTDEIPEYYALQVTHEMIVTGRKTADLAVLIGGNDFRIYSVHFNDALATALTRIEEDFWGKVQRREPPEPDWSHPDTPKLIAMLHKDGDGVNVDLDEEAYCLARRHEELSEMIKRCDAEREMVKQDLYARIGAPGIGYLPNGRGEVHYKHISFTRKAIEAKEVSYPKLVVKLED